MLYSVVLFLETKPDLFFPPTTGEFMNGVFYKLLSNFDKNLFDTIHNISDLKPFTISPLFGSFKKTNYKHQITINPESPLWFRITLLNDKLFFNFAKALKNKNLTKINIGKNELSIKDVFLTKDKHFLASFDTFNDLLKPSYYRKAIINFVTPTTFFVDKNNYPLPDPRLFFSSLINKWNTFTYDTINFKIDNAKKEELLKYVVVSKYNIETKIYNFSSFSKVGFVGEVEYHIKTKKSDIINLFNSLIKFSFYSGVGSKTTMGMGQVEVKKMI